MEGKFKGEQTRNRGREKAEAMEPWASLREETRARLKTLGFRRFYESEVPRARRVCGDTPSVLEAQGGMSTRETPERRNQSHQSQSRRPEIPMRTELRFSASRRAPV
eukprot:CAMPEP_0197123738 /NCGR_PEP_ID=MMETSP1390-20130617/6887_1 /TAXON_ID=38833 /ORGANISM="Micromonas sp., Strain CCMP2099" /LENGTH=106 /DNA_ID=CAMNT_0042565807 /DNA_START=83 /DNA_END=404 /DNA_ORIENTATION=+